MSVYKIKYDQISSDFLKWFREYTPPHIPLGNIDADTIQYNTETKEMTFQYVAPEDGKVIAYADTGNIKMTTGYINFASVRDGFVDVDQAPWIKITDRPGVV